MNTEKSALYGPLVVSGAVGMVALGGALVILMLRATLGPFQFLGAEPVEIVERLALWSGGDAREQAHQRRRWSARLQDRWTVVSVDGPEAARKADCGALLVDGIELDAERVAALQRFAANGAGVGMFGVTAPDAAAHPLTRLSNVPVRRIALRRASFARANDGALAAGLFVGEQIPVQHGTLFGSDDAAAELAWLPPASEPGGTLGAGLRTTLGAGRLGWLAVRPDAADDTQAARESIDSVSRALVAWLARAPFPEVVAGPERTRAVLAGVRARIEVAGPRRFLLSLSNAGRVRTTEIPLRIHLNRAVVAADVAATTLGIAGSSAPPRSTLRRDAQILELVLPATSAGASRSYTLDLLYAEVGREEAGSV